MAKLKKKSSHLQREYRHKQHRTLRFLFLSLLGVIWLVAGISPYQPALLGAGTLWFGICLVLALLPARDLNGLKAGIDGEDAAASLLETLPDSYRCYQNATVSYRGKISEIDFIAVGPEGIFIVEVKNLNGAVTGAYEESHWTQHKTGRRGGVYEKHFYSPVKQVGTHIYRLAHYLQGHGCRVHIDAAVLFANPETTVSLQGDVGDIPVFSGKDAGKQLLRHITNRKTALSPETQKELFRLLNSL